jgi:Tol biopolymer transport system component
MERKNKHVFVGLVFAALLLSAVELSAQYFGQNKVRYKTLDFKILQTEHFDIYYYDEEKVAVDLVGRMAERWYLRLSRVLGHEMSSRQPVVLYANSVDFRGTTVIPNVIGETTGGVTEALRRRVVLPLAGPLAETDHVLGHELVHAFQYDVTANGPGGGNGLPGAVQLPLWFIEGMAEYLSLGPVDPHTSMWLRDAVRREDVPKISKLSDFKYFPYRFGHAFWAYLAGRFGDEVIGKILRSAGRSGNPETAISSIVKTPIAQLSQDWQESLSDQYEPILNATNPVAEQAKLLLGSPEIAGVGKRAGEMNLSPVISPDGTRLVFYSEKDLFSIDLYLADAHTGRILRKISETAIDPHFDSFQFVNSAGTWSPDSRRFAYGGIANGRPRLTIYDVSKDDVVQEIDIPGVGEILSPAWSPDGKTIAFSAIAGGLTDLFTYDLQAKKLTRLTNDAFADLDPAWSPDGQRLAFSTDRFTSNLETLAFGDYRLAAIEVSRGTISQLSRPGQGKQIDPQWVENGVYFVSDRSGISNAYRLVPSTGETHQITNIQTGISAISALSPAISVSSNGQRLTFNAFLGRSYAIYVLEQPGPQKGAQRPFERRAAASLPPLNRHQELVASLLEDDTRGLANPSGFQRKPYEPKLSLEYVAPPSISLGATPYGTAMGGGIALYFSDLLGQHNLITAVQSSSYAGGNVLRNLSGSATYLNQKGRWTWGATGGQISFLTGAFGESLGSVEGEPVLVQDSITFWQIHREISGIAAYPLSRARRLEFNAGFRSLDFVAERSQDLFLLSTGQLVGRQEEDIPAPDTINMAVGSAAFVHDTSVFGGTSRVMGQRYRFEGGMAGGGLNFGTLLGDFRQYLRLARPLSLAGRLLHFGRYGGGARDSRLQDLFLGYPSLVRGYDPGSFDAHECESSSIEDPNSCPVFDRLIGSQIAVANAELRLALLGPLGTWKTPNIPPVEIAPFYDAGIAWKHPDTPRFANLKQRLTSSYGVSLRVNLLGFAIGQISYVKPLDRPARSTVWEFALMPGF